MGFLRQIFGSLIICGLCMSLGLILTWPSSTFRLFESKNTTLNRPMTESELAMFGSLSSVGALVGTPIVGMILDRLGRRNTALLFSSLGVVSWAIIAVCKQVEIVLIAVFIAGLNGAGYLVVPVYTSEICQESIRGAMTSCTMAFTGIGSLISYLLGGYLEYQMMVYACISISVVTTAGLMILKESPTCLMTKGREKEAAEAIAFYRGVKVDDKEVFAEINAIKRTLNPELDDETPETEKLNPEKAEKEKFSFWIFLKKSRATRQAFFLTMFLTTASVLQGPMILQVYAGPLFEQALPSMSTNVATILLAVIGIISGGIAAYFIEKAGRRALMIYSSFLIAAICIILGIQIHVEWGPNWLVGVNVYLFMMVFSCGAGAVPYVVMAEVFLPQVKSYVSMIVIEWAWFCNSVVLFIFNPLLKAIGLGPVFYIFAGVGIITGVYCMLYMPETKGLTIDEIQLRLAKKGFKK